MTESLAKKLAWLVFFLSLASLGVALAFNPIATAIVICGWLNFACRVAESCDKPA